MTNQEKLRNIMFTNGLTHKDVAELIHRSKSSVLKYMSGHALIRVELVRVLELKVAERAR